MVRQIIYFQFYVCNYLCMVRQKLPSPFDVCIIYVCNTKKLMSYSCKFLQIIRKNSSRRIYIHASCKIYKISILHGINLAITCVLARIQTL